MKNKESQCNRYRWRHLLALLTMTLWSTFAWAQLTVKGTVSDNSDNSVIGASVKVKGSPHGAITDLDGHYMLNNVAPNDVLIFSYIGYQALEIPVNGRTVIDVVLTEDRQMLDEVVVVGYGSLSRKELSSSIIQVNKEQFQQGGMNNIMELLSGKVAGLNVSTTSPADPNGSSSLQVRGAASLKAGNNPLIVIDGVAGGSIRNLAPQDIESMTVLKDAASAAIYGTRGANGVILITTKKGNGIPGKPTLTYDSYFSVNLAKDGPDILSPDEWRRSRRGYDFGYETRWYNELMRDFSYDTNQYISIDGATDNGYYTAALNYKRAVGLDIVSGRKEYGARATLQQSFLDKRLQITFNLNGRKVKEDWGNNSVFDTALGLNPTLPIYNADGSYYQPTSPTNVSNPVARLREEASQGNRTYLLGTVETKLNIINKENHTLNTTLSYSYDYNDLKSDFYTPSTSSESFWNGYKGRAEIKYQKWWTNRLEWTSNYLYHHGEHDFKGMLGYTYERSNWEQMYMQNNDFTFDNMLWHGIGAGSYLTEGKAQMYAGKTESTLIGFFGRLNYNWRDLLFASVSLRHEGSTKFSKNNKWGNFPAASVAWEMANMPFLKDYTDHVQSLKLRISYGVTGRSGFDAYQSLATYAAKGYYQIDGEWGTGYAPSNNANNELSWEKSSSTNYGLDFMLWKHFYGSIEYFDRRSEDLLYTYRAPQPPYVYSDILVNVGSIRNTGIEVQLTGDLFTHTPITWTTGINWSYGSTKLSKLSNDVYQASYLDLYMKPGAGTSEYFFRIKEGGYIGQFYGYEYAGVDADGNMLVLDAKGEKVLSSKATAKDKRYIGNGVPKHFLTWDNTLRYHNFDLHVMFQGAFGHKIFNMRKYGMGLSGSGSDNVLRSAYLDDRAVVNSGGVISSFFLERGDYFKLSNATLGYTVPLKQQKTVESLRLYLASKNLFTMTGYSGNDPSIVTQTGITPGIDVNNAYPQATQVTLGVTLRLK